MRGGLRSILLLLPLVLAGCLGDRPRQSTTAARRVAVDPDVVNFSRRGDQLILAGRVYRGAVLAADSAAFVWRSVDPGVAAVAPDGVVTASGDGVTRIWGVSGTDSAFAVVVVETPVAPVVVTLAPSRLQFSALTAAALLTVTSSDTLSRDSVPACRSEDPRVAVVENVTVRAQGNGSTRLRCSVAGVAAGGSVAVTVQQRISRVRVTADVPFVLREGRDSLTLGLARVDSLRQPVARGTPRFVSLDTGIVRVDEGSGTVVAAKLGAGRIVGSIEGFADTAVIRVVENSAAPTLSSVSSRRAGGAAAAGARRPGTRSVISRTGAQRPSSAQIGAREFEERDSIFQAPGVGRASPFTRWEPALYGAYVERQVLDSANGIADVGRSTGFMFGGSLEATPVRHLRITLGGLYGSLAAATGSVNGESGTVAEAQADVSVSPFSWLWFHVGVGRRAFKPDVGALAQWTSMRVGGEARYGFGKGALQGVVRTTYLPLVSVPDSTTRPNLAVAMDAGVDYRAGLVTLGIRYGLERLDFPEAAGSRRREQFSVLRVRVGLELGR